MANQPQTIPEMGPNPNTRSSAHASIVWAAMIFVAVMLIATGGVFYSIWNKHAAVEKTATALATELATEAAEANLENGASKETMLTDYQDSWGHNYKAIVTGKIYVVEGVVISPGPNGKFDARRLVTSGADAGEWQHGDDIVATVEVGRPKMWQDLLRDGSASAAEGAVGGMVDGAKSKLSDIGDVIKESAASAAQGAFEGLAEGAKKHLDDTQKAENGSQEEKSDESVDEPAETSNN